MLAANFILGRIGWIFKTESVIVPAFVDAVSGAGWVRGLLPIVNRLFQSIPPFLLAGYVKRARLKKRVYFVSAIGMAIPFACIGFVLLHVGAAPPPGWLVWFFLALYAAFFAGAGIWNNVNSSLQGKLIAPQHRGRLMAAGTSIGAVSAALFAWRLLPRWLEAPGTLGFAYAFLCAGGFLGLAALCAPLLREPPDEPDPEAPKPLGVVRVSLGLLREQPDLRRAVLLNVFFVTSLALLPHYQALARDALGLGGFDWMVWVVVQNVSMAVVSLVMGPLADRMGNRLALRIVIFTSAGVPILALWIAGLAPALGGRLFPLIFVGLGLTPIVLRLFANYVLEITPREDQPHALALTQVSSVVALAASPALGALIDVAGYAPTFGVVALALGVAGGLTFGLSEPRRRPPLPSP